MVLKRRNLILGVLVLAIGIVAVNPVCAEETTVDGMIEKNMEYVEKNGELLLEKAIAATDEKGINIQQMGTVSAKISGNSAIKKSQYVIQDDTLLTCGDEEYKVLTVAAVIDENKTNKNSNNEIESFQTARVVGNDGWDRSVGLHAFINIYYSVKNDKDSIPHYCLTAVTGYYTKSDKSLGVKNQIVTYREMGNSSFSGWVNTGVVQYKPTSTSWSVNTNINKYVMYAGTPDTINANYQLDLYRINGGSAGQINVNVHLGMA